MPTSVNAEVRDHGRAGQRKGTQAALLAGDFDLVHLSVGDSFRWHVQHHTKLGAQVRRIMAAGQLVDDDLVESVVRERLAMHDWNYGFVLYGFPRNARQAEFFLESYDIDGVIILHLPDQVVHQRVRRAGCAADAGSTGICSPTGRSSPTSATCAGRRCSSAPTTTPRRWRCA